RVYELRDQMTPEEKHAQVVGYWADQRDAAAGNGHEHAGDVAPRRGAMATPESATHGAASRHGIGHVTRLYGTHPAEPAERARWRWQQQRGLRADTRLGIPALVHEETLTGLAVWQAATFPTPLAWGASFDPDLVERMGALIGASMRELGIHQG